MIFYTVYRTTNKLNNKFYIGAHCTDDIHDSYMGSGEAITEAFLKYGKENFNKEILAIFDNEKSMYDFEALLVDQDLIRRQDCYNKCPGGRGGVGKKKRSIEQIEKLRQRKISTETRLKMSQSAKSRPSNRKGTKMSAETKRKISLIQKEKNWRPPSRKGMPQILKRVQCPHCDKIGAANLMKRWHFDNCKSKSPA